MGKTYIDTVKYLIYANVKVEGLVDKPDIVGAIFGQTEGLLGDELDLRDLQKNGRIGRIEVEKNVGGKSGSTSAIIKIPSSLDMVETSIIAAALEAVDRVGPCEANIFVDKIEDTRNIKRKKLVERAKSLLKSLIDTELPESREISESVRDEVKKEEITSYGPDKLPAGPGIDRAKEIIIVEGRADVLNLLKNDITNVVAMQGARVLPTILELTKKKETTLFLDGDRGGDLIIRSLVEAGAEIDFVARAPRGKEVEELARKEMIKCMRNRIPFDQDTATKNEGIQTVARTYGPELNEPDVKIVVTPATIAPRYEPSVVKRPNVIISSSPKIVSALKPEPVPEKPLKKISTENMMSELDELKDSLKARLYNENLELLTEIRVRDVIRSLEEKRGISLIIFDGIITQRLVDLAHDKGVKTIVGVKIGNVNKKPEGLEIKTRDK